MIMITMIKLLTVLKKQLDVKQNYSLNTTHSFYNLRIISNYR